jgi:hypothetical protein
MHLGAAAAALNCRFKLFAPLFWLFDVIFNSPLLPSLFARIASKDNIASALQNVYVDPTAVDAELVDIFYAPSQDAGALDTFVAILTGFAGPMPDQVRSHPHATCSFSLWRSRRVHLSIPACVRSPDVVRSGHAGDAERALPGGRAVGRAGRRHGAGRARGQVLSSAGGER